jgi:hypothetical protein
MIHIRMFYLSRALGLPGKLLLGLRACFSGVFFFFVSFGHSSGFAQVRADEGERACRWRSSAQSEVISAWVMR